MSEPTEPPYWYDAADPCHVCGDLVPERGKNGYYDLHDDCEAP